MRLRSGRVVVVRAAPPGRVDPARFYTTAQLDAQFDALMCSVATRGCCASMRAIWAITPPAEKLLTLERFRDLVAT